MRRVKEGGGASDMNIDEEDTRVGSFDLIKSNHCLQSSSC